MATLTPPARPEAPEPRPCPPAPRTDPERQAATPPAGGWRQVALAVVVAATVFVPRSIAMTNAHSDSYDDDYHLTRGLTFLTRSFGSADLRMNDPPLGEGLVALPMLVTNVVEGRKLTDDRLYDRPGRAETLAFRAGVWNSLMALPLVGVVFAWCQSVYGARSAWLVTGLLLVEPTFAALIPVPTPDIAGVSGIVVGCYLAWRYFERPSSGRLIAAGVAGAAALMLKHTAAILPFVILAMAGLEWVVRPWLERSEFSAWLGTVPGRVRRLATMALVGAISLWALTLFDVSPPISSTTSEHAVGPTDRSTASQGHSLRIRLENALRLTDPWPAGVYLRAFRTGLGHGIGGHEAYLLGEKRITGWWYYYPVVASYKVPIGIAIVILLAVGSLLVTPPRWAEWGLAIPLLAWTAFLMKSSVNIGFRHFLPAYVFFLAMAGRCVAQRGRVWTVAAWSAVVAAALHVASFHPDYLCYINAPRHKPHLAISDSNVDWGQSLKQVRDWLDAHPQRDRAVSLHYFGKDDDRVRYYLGDRVVVLANDDPPPTRGLLIISGVQEASPYDPRDVYTTLWPHEPEAVIGHCMLVYDLDKLGGGSPFRWVYPNGVETAVSSVEPRSARNAGEETSGNPRSGSGLVRR
jgi:hypothetical protein